MKPIKTIVTLMLLLTLSVSAQQKLHKISQSINVNDKATIDLNTSYTNIEIDTWNKDIIEVEAYIESNELSQEALKKYFDNWQITVNGSKDLVTIYSEASNQSWNDGLGLFNNQSLDALKELEFELANMPKMPVMDGLMESLNLAEMPKMPKMPKLPDLPEGMTQVDFDYERYKEEGEAYMNRWSKEYSNKYGKEYAKKMEEWAKQVEESDFKTYEKEMEAWGEKFGKEFGDKFGKEMEAWGEEFGKRFGKDMEAWGEQFGKQMEEQAKVLELRLKENEKVMQDREKAMQEQEKAYNNLLESYSNKPSLKFKKTIKIKMPKDAKLKVNVRHGELKFASNITNLKADLTHGSLLATSIDGENTSINASYTKLFIKQWQMGALKLNFVEDAILQQVKGLVLNSNSSNINIDNLSGNAIINGSFGDLTIHNISELFNNINITLDNSLALVKLPEVDYNLQYNGKNSRLQHPVNTKGKGVATFNFGSLKNNKTIVINAKYSNIIME